MANVSGGGAKSSDAMIRMLLLAILLLVAVLSRPAQSSVVFASRVDIEPPPASLSFNSDGSDGALRVTGCWRYPSGERFVADGSALIWR